MSKRKANKVIKALDTLERNDLLRVKAAVEDKMNASGDAQNNPNESGIMLRFCEGAAEDDLDMCLRVVVGAHCEPQPERYRTEWHKISDTLVDTARQKVSGMIDALDLYNKCASSGISRSKVFVLTVSYLTLLAKIDLSVSSCGRDSNDARQVIEALTTPWVLLRGFRVKTRKIHKQLVLVDAEGCGDRLLAKCVAAVRESENHVPTVIN